MKIAWFISGKVRTLFFKFHKNLELIRDRYPNCDIDVYYSFWDVIDRTDNINDPWHFKAENYNLDSIDKDYIDNYFSLHGVKSVGEIESCDVMNEVISKSPFVDTKKGLSSQYYKMYRVVEKYFNDNYKIIEYSLLEHIQNTLPEYTISYVGCSPKRVFIEKST